MEILHFDKNIAVCVKPVGLDAEHQVPEALKTALGGEIYTLHRLDKNVGGIMVTNKAVSLLKQKGYNLILATNPLFPKEAIVKRANWGGIDCDVFSYITSYENSSYAKPNVNYYMEILEKNNLDANETIMFGNDLVEDLAIEKINVPCYIIKNNMINIENLNNCTKKGDYDEFYNYISNLPNIN